LPWTRYCGSYLSKLKIFSAESYQLRIYPQNLEKRYIKKRYFLENVILKYPFTKVLNSRAGGIWNKKKAEIACWDLANKFKIFCLGNRRKFSPIINDDIYLKLSYFMAKSQHVPTQWNLRGGGRSSIDLKKYFCRIVRITLKGLSNETDLGFDDMYG
jgi:hypothetical protein